MKKDHFIWAVGLMAVWALAAPGRAWAYLDPGTGSYLFQILIAALVGGLFAVKIFWSRIKLFFQGLFGKKRKEDAGGDDDAGPVQPE